MIEPDQFQLIAQRLLAEKEAAAAHSRAKLASLRKTLGKKQLAYLQSIAPRKTLGGARQSGKSHDIATDIIETGFASRTRSMYVAPTSKAARGAVWTKLHDINDSVQLGIELREGRFQATFPTGAECGFEGAHDTARVKRLRGATLTGKLWVDEAAFFPDALIRELVGPVASSMFTASPNGQRVTIASSPGLQRRGYFFDLCHNQTDAWEAHSLTVFDNPVIKDPEGALRALREINAWTIDSPAYRREGLGEWVDDVTHRVYDLSDINLIDEFPEGPWTTVMTIDFGSNDQTALAVLGWRDYDPALYCLHLEGHSDLDIEDVAQKIIPLRERYAPIGTYADHGGGGKQHGDYLRNRHNLPIMPVSKSPNYKHPAIEAFNADMRRGLYRILRTSPGVEQMQNLQWDPGSLARGKHLEHPSMPNDLCDVQMYGHMHARHFRAEPAPPPKPTYNTQQHWQDWSDSGLQSAIRSAADYDAQLEQEAEERAILTGEDY